MDNDGGRCRRRCPGEEVVVFLLTVMAVLGRSNEFDNASHSRINGSPFLDLRKQPLSCLGSTIILFRKTEVRYDVCNTFTRIPRTHRARCMETDGITAWLQPVAARDQRT